MQVNARDDVASSFEFDIPVKVEVIMNWGTVIFIVAVIGFVWMRFGSNPDLSGVELSSAIVLDVRSPSEFSSGHVTGAINIPVQSLQKDSIEAIVKKERPILVYCRSGARASAAVQTLKGWGFTNVYNLRTQSGVESVLK